MKAFPNSFDHVGNMPGTYTICLDPSVPPAQHARSRVPIEYKEQIEKVLQHMEDLKDHHTSNYTNRMGFFNNIPLKTRWNTVHMFRP